MGWGVWGEFQRCTPLQDKLNLAKFLFPPLPAHLERFFIFSPALAHLKTKNASLPPPPPGGQWEKRGFLHPPTSARHRSFLPGSCFLEKVPAFCGGVLLCVCVRECVRPSRQDPLAVPQPGVGQEEEEEGEGRQRHPLQPPRPLMVPSATLQKGQPRVGMGGREGAGGQARPCELAAGCPGRLWLLLPPPPSVCVCL